MKVKVDPDTCIGSGLCVETCPEVFKMKGDVSTVIVDVVPQKAEERCRQAAEECPAVAITVSDE
jgi:ferredoxin